MYDIFSLVVVDEKNVPLEYSNISKELSFQNKLMSNILGGIAEIIIQMLFLIMSNIQREGRVIY